MDLVEGQGKRLLAEAGVAVPVGRLVSSADDAAAVAAELGGGVVCKAQVPTGKRGKAGAIKIVDTADEARAAATALLGMTVGDHPVTSLLIEERIDIAHECYAAVLDDPGTKGPMILFSAEGGMDIEEVAERAPDALHRLPFDVRQPPTTDALEQLVSAVPAALPVVAVATVLDRLVRCYLDRDATLVEVNPLVVTGADAVLAVDAKISIDPASVPRQSDALAALVGELPSPGGTDLEQRGRELGLTYIELDGDVGILANGAGLTMTTLDVVHHYGGRPANFLEIGGDAYTKATPALELVLSNPQVRCVLVNFCGAFARTDVMTEGVLDAIDALQPRVPIVFTVHGTGEAAAVDMIRRRRGEEPYDVMDDAVRAAVGAGHEQGDR